VNLDTWRVLPPSIGCSAGPPIDLAAGLAGTAAEPQQGVAEGEGFEPPKACTLVVFKTVVPSFANVRGRSPSSAPYFTLPLIVRQRSPTFAIVRCGCRHGCRHASAELRSQVRLLLRFLTASSGCSLRRRGGVPRRRNQRPDPLRCRRFRSRHQVESFEPATLRHGSTSVRAAEYAIIRRVEGLDLSRSGSPPIPP